MKKCPSCQAEVEDSLLRCPRCGAPLQKKEEGNPPFLSHDVSSLNPTVPSGVGREKMPREKKLLVGSLVAGSLGIVLAIVALAIGGLPAAVFAGGVGVILSLYGLLAAFQRGKRPKFALADIASFAVPGVAFLLSLVAFLLGILL